MSIDIEKYLIKYEKIGHEMLFIIFDMLIAKVCASMLIVKSNKWYTTNDIR